MSFDGRKGGLGIFSAISDRRTPGYGQVLRSTSADDRTNAFVHRKSIAVHFFAFSAGALVSFFFLRPDTARRPFFFFFFYQRVSYI